MVVRRLLRQPGRTLSAAGGIGAGMALTVAMLSVMSAFERSLELSFGVIDRSDATLSFIEPLSDKTLLELGRMAGVIEVEPFRQVAVMLRHGRHSYRGAISGLVGRPRLNRPVDKHMQGLFIRADGLILGESLAQILRVQPGQSLSVEVREGRRPRLQLPVAGVAETLLGAPAYLELGALNRALQEPNRVSGAYLRVDSAQGEALYRTLKEMPAVAGVSLRSEARTALRKLLDSGAGAIRYVMAAIAAIITFGIVYNSARIAFAERARDLASMRVLGLTRGEAAFVLLGELALITLLALPLGALLGYYLTEAVATGFSTDLYRVPLLLVPSSYGIAALAVLAAATLSGWLVKRDLDRLAPIDALKTQE
ncbi:ABC transporter permease [Pseudomonas benzenivorans]|uniref:ABC transporter permease n=1 Tax=Pseudomonas benzenivorans TaxID=556533 RepID=UPI0035136CC3